MHDEYRTIPLTRGKVALVDPDDFERFGHLKWRALCINGSWYAAHRKESILLHRAIMDHPPGHVDHRNGDGLDCRKTNLRRATQSQNLANSRIRPGNRSGYKGVTQVPRSGRYRYQARINVEGRQIILGVFDDPAEAGRAYDDAARHHFGEFCCVNFPREGERSATT